MHVVEVRSNLPAKIKSNFFSKEKPHYKSYTSNISSISCTKYINIVYFRLNVRNVSNIFRFLLLMYLIIVTFYAIPRSLHTFAFVLRRLLRRNYFQFLYTKDVYTRVFPSRFRNKFKWILF